MKAFNITSKIVVAVSEEFKATFDAHADFNQIILRVRNGDKFVNFRVTDLGDTVTIEFAENNKISHEIRLTNDGRHEKAFETLMAIHLN